MLISIYGDVIKFDKEGEDNEDHLINNNLSLFNNKSITYVHHATEKQTSLDLKIITLILFFDWTWEVHSDQCGSDNFPIILNSNTTPVQRWKLKKANWLSFNYVNQKYHRLNTYIPNSMEVFAFTLYSIADRTILKRRQIPNRTKVIV